MVGCFVPRCASGHRKGEKSHLFRPSSQAAAEWVTVMRKLRTDKAFDPNNDNHRVCHEHFKDDEILSNYTCVINGILATIPRGRRTLATGAVPRIFKDLPPSLQPVISKTRRQIHRRSIGCFQSRSQQAKLFWKKIKNFPAQPLVCNVL